MSFGQSGFKVSVAVLDAFLAANGVDETNGTPPFYKHHPDEDPILYTKITKAGGTADKNKFRLRLVQDLPVKVPTGFKEPRMEILSFGDGISDSNKIADEGRMGLFVVYTRDIRGLYIPQENIERAKVPQHCDQCDAILEAFGTRQEHRINVHGSREGINPFPEA
ncbi:hypothetical protein V8E54_013315 [Elaphomyces granulatus]